MKDKIKLILAYDGTHYGGWQIQPNVLTIQQILEEKLKILVKEEVRVTGAGRTDAGVHALGQTAHFRPPRSLELNKLRASLNGLLPHDIRVKTVESVPTHFHARYSARNKVYHYHLNLAPVQDPFKRLYSWHLTDHLNLENLQKAARYCVGTHDFTSFANEAYSGAAGKNPVRTLKRLEMVQEREGIRLEFEAESFLYKMVRNLTGTLIDVARGKLPPEQILEVFEAKDRRRASRAAPAKGLFLVRVDYPEEIREWGNELPLLEETPEAPDS